jgi:hypothetical protein
LNLNLDQKQSLKINISRKLCQEIQNYEAFSNKNEDLFGRGAKIGKKDTAARP